MSNQILKFPGVSPHENDMVLAVDLITKNMSRAGLEACIECIIKNRDLNVGPGPSINEGVPFEISDRLDPAREKPPAEGSPPMLQSKEETPLTKPVTPVVKKAKSVGVAKVQKKGVVRKNAFAHGEEYPLYAFINKLSVYGYEAYYLHENGESSFAINGFTYPLSHDEEVHIKIAKLTATIKRAKNTPTWVASEVTITE